MNFNFNLQAESCGLELGATSKSVGSSMAQLLTAASQVCLHSVTASNDTAAQCRTFSCDSSYNVFCQLSLNHCRQATSRVVVTTIAREIAHEVTNIRVSFTAFTYLHLSTLSWVNVQC